MLILFIGRAKAMFKRQCRIAEAMSNEIGPSVKGSPETQTRRQRMCVLVGG